jgi:pimeloyl-ACP methyl ester carboxylesterase
VTALWVEEAGPADASPIVLVHGSMDRSAGLLKLSRRLDEAHYVVRYDRRGYGRSGELPGPYTLQVHVDDLEHVLAGRRVVVFGHSYGGNVALALAQRRPDLLQAVAVYETPLSWLPWWPATTAGSDALATVDGAPLQPADAAERFMRRLIGDDRWRRLPARTRRARRAEGAAMIEELDDLRQRAPWDPAAIEVPVVAMRGAQGAEHHRRSTAHLGAVLADCRVIDIEGARHFGPNTHPDAVAHAVHDLAIRTR